MIELVNDSLAFSFPEVHPEARLTIQFQRTLRIPDTEKTYPLPPGLGKFPLRHVDDYAQGVPPKWLDHGGVMMPMYQAEAFWLNFSSTYFSLHRTSYPFAIKVATGKIDAVTGKSSSNELRRDPQNYMVAPTQPWLDGYCVSKGVIRQFVAMPLGEGFTAEEQITGEAEHGGLQLVVYPMKRAAFERRFPKIAMRASVDSMLAMSDDVRCSVGFEMGLAPGGRMKQEIYNDPFDLEDWEFDHRSRCFIHILNSHQWQTMTGERPPHRPPNAMDYSSMGLPWFDYYSEGSQPTEGSAVLAGLQSVSQKAGQIRDHSNVDISVLPEQVIKLRAGLKRNQVRDGRF
jgi:hypothetical protein